MVTKQQIIIIHTLKAKLGWDDDLYRDVLSKYGVKSSTKLSDSKAEKMVAEMRKASGNKSGAYYKKKYSKYSRTEMATPAQLRAIEGMWADVSRQKDPELRAKALRTLVKKIVKVDDIKFLGQDQVRKIMAALESMGALKPEEYIEAVNKERKQTTIGG